MSYRSIESLELDMYYKVLMKKSEVSFTDEYTRVTKNVCKDSHMLYIFIRGGCLYIVRITELEHGEGTYGLYEPRTDKWWNGDENHMIRGMIKYGRYT